MEKFAKNLAFSLLIALGTLTVIILIVGPSRVLSALHSAKPSYLFLTLGLWMTSIALESISFMVGSRFSSTSMGFSQGFLLTIIGRFFSAITPFATGGQPAQAYVMTKKDNIDIAEGLGILVIKFLMYQFVITFYGVVILIFAYPLAKRYISNLASLAFIGFALNSFAIFLILLFSLNEKFTRGLLHFIINTLAFLRLIREPGKLKDEMVNKIRTFRSILKNISHFPLRTSFMALLILGQYVAAMAMAYTVYKAFGGSGHSILEIIGIQSVLTLLVGFVPTPGASGAQEGVFFLLYKNLLGVNVGGALVAWRFFSYYINIIVGAMFLPSSKPRRNSHEE